MNNLRFLFQEHVAQTSPEPLGLETARAEGVYVYDTSGKKYLDLISGIAVSNIGHCAPEVLKAIKDQSKNYIFTMVYGEHIQSPQVKLAEKLADVLDSDLSVTYFVNSGSEAVEGAMKVAKKFTGRTQFVSTLNSYHGGSHGALSVTSIDQLKDGYGPFLPGVIHIPYNDVSALSAINEETAAFILEPVQSATAYTVPDDGYLKAVRKRCDETGTLLILDEIQTAYARTGRLFNHQLAGITPDILLLAKGMGGGMPLAAFITRKEIMEVIRDKPALGHITTFGGHPVCCAAGLATLNKIVDERLSDQVAAKEAVIRKGLAHPAIKKIQGTGLMLAAFLDSFEQVHNLMFACLRKGLLTDWFLSENKAFRISPPLIISVAELKEALSILNDALDEVCGKF